VTLSFSEFGVQALGTETNSNARGTRDPEEGSKDFCGAEAVLELRLLSVPEPLKPFGGPDYRRALAPDRPKSDTPSLRKRPAKRRKFSSFWLEPAGPRTA
jgi:hypothetical protein